MKKRDVVGMRFGRLVISEELEPRRYARSVVRRVRAQCDCGGRTDTSLSNLDRGKAKSCGCLLIERNTSHGMTNTRIFATWSSMLNRARGRTDPADYKDRGIGVCDRWLKFENFYADMGDAPEGLSLDRIDNNRGYSPENCRWATWNEQARNRRSNRMLTYQGETLCLIEMATKHGLSKGLLGGRLDQGWSLEKALTTPVRPRKKPTHLSVP